MKLKEILSISGQSGLYKFVAQSGNGIIVESLADGKRMNVPSSARVSSLGEIAIFTEGEDMPLTQVFNKMSAHTEGKQAVSHKDTPEKIKSFFEKAIAEYDRERVRFSDMKKILSWFNILIDIGLTDFTENEEAVEEVVEDVVDAVS